MGQILLGAARYGEPYLFTFLILLAAACLIVGAVVLTSIWSGDKARRRDARATLKLLLRRSSDE